MESLRVVIVALALAACSTGGGGGSDQVADPGDATIDDGVVAADQGLPDPGESGPADAAPETRPWFDPAGHVRLVENPSPASPDLASSQVSAFFWDAPDPTIHALAATEGACQLWLALPPVDCGASCEDATHYCGRDGACHPRQRRIQAGTIHVTGLSTALALAPDGSGWYTTQPEETPANLFAPGAAIQVKADGGDVPAFEASVEGVGDMLTSIQGLYLLDVEDAVIPFTPQGDGATVELILQAGWHGAPPSGILWCVVDDADGKVVVPKSLVEGFPIIGTVGLFQHPSYLRRVSRAWVDVPHGPIEILAASQAGLWVIHEYE